MTIIEQCHKAEADAFSELLDARAMPAVTAQQILHRNVMVQAKAENLAHVVGLNRKHMKQTPDGCVLD